MDFSVILNVAVLLIFIGILYYLHKKHVKFSNRVFLALAFGVILGIGLHFVYGVESESLSESMAWYNIIGSGYVKLLQMIVA